MIRIEKWNEFKAIADEFSTSIQCVHHGNWYYLYIFRSGIPFYHVLPQTSPANSDQTDFEDNYQSMANQIVLGYKNTITGNGNDAHVTSGNRLQVEDSEPSATETPGSPVMTAKVRSIISDTEISLNNSGQSHTVLYSYSGKGKLYNYTLCFDDDDVFSRLVVDGEEIFNIDCDILEGMTNNDGYRSDILGWFHWDRSKNIFTFKPDYPIVYNTSVSIEAKANSGSNNRDLEAYIISLSQEP